MKARNQEMYGVADIEQYAANTMEQIDNTSCAMPELILEMMERARYAISIAPLEAEQTINRAKYLITRYCPTYRQPDQAAG